MHSANFIRDLQHNDSTAPLFSAIASGDERFAREGEMDRHQRQYFSRHPLPTTYPSAAAYAGGALISALFKSPPAPFGWDGGARSTTSTPIFMPYLSTTLVLENLKEWPFCPLKRRAKRRAAALIGEDENAVSISARAETVYRDFRRCRGHAT